MIDGNSYKVVDLFKIDFSPEKTHGGMIWTLKGIINVRGENSKINT